MSTPLELQIERIVDEADTDEVEVIVQTLPNDRRVTDLVKASATAIRTRRALISARDLVPPARRELRSRTEEAPSASRAAFGETSSARRRSLTDSHRHGERALAPLMQWAGSKTSVGRSPMRFTASGSAVLSLSRAVLSQLPASVNNLSAVYRNQRVSLPPMASSTALPRVVWDNRGHTWGVARSGALACWGAYGARGQGVRIAVLDTGCDARHPDVKARLVGFAEIDDAGRIAREGLKHARDSDRHGTHCAGSAVGGNASGRWIGMAPEAELLAGMVLPGGSGTEAQILGGMQWALDNGADIISLSLGGLRLEPVVLDNYTQMIISANLAGVPVVVAIGNEGAQTSGAPGNDYFAFTVGATDVEDVAAGFSGGRTQVVARSRYIVSKDLPLVYSKPDVSAPGVDVFSCVPGGGHEVLSGTSMATPHVAGAMAVLLSALPNLRALQGTDRVNVLQQLLISSVKELGEAGQNHRYGFGRIDVLRAVGFGKELGY
jgi:subtilisin family serine protease